VLRESAVGHGVARTISGMWRYSEGRCHSNRKWSHGGSTTNRVGRLSPQTEQNQPPMPHRKNMDHRAGPGKAEQPEWIQLL